MQAGGIYACTLSLLVCSLCREQRESMWWTKLCEREMQLLTDTHMETAAEDLATNNSIDDYICRALRLARMPGA